MNLRRWLTPGIGIKRWLLVVFVGLVLLALGVAHVLRQISRDLEPGGPAGTLIDLLTLQFLPYPWRGLIVGVVGLGLVAIGSIRVIRAFMAPFRSTEGDQPLVEVIYQKRYLARGPRVVAIGGGTGLSMLLRGLKEHTSNITAVVTVADDGGSSGVLRHELGIPPVGDIRNCIAALADAEPLMNELLQYRFPASVGGSGSTSGSVDAPGTVADGATDGAPVASGSAGLGGHAVGNLLIAAMTAVEDGDFEEGIRQMNRILAVRGQVVPASATPLTLHARLRDGSDVDGQSRIMRTAGIERVWVTPEAVRPCDDALIAIAEAELIVLGPGSLYTSLLPSLLIPGIRDAVVASSALRVFACNVATQTGETDGMDLAAHVDALIEHTAPGIVDLVLANNQFDARAPEPWTARPVQLRWPPAASPAPKLVLDAVVDPGDAHRHDSARLAEGLLRVLEREGATRRRAVGRTA